MHRWRLTLPTGLLAALVLVVTAVFELGFAVWAVGAALVFVTGALASRALRPGDGSPAAPHRTTVASVYPLVLGVVFAIGVLALPSMLVVRGNGEVTAWVAPPREAVVFAEAGVAITTNDDVARGRDLDDGHLLWTTPLEPAGGRGAEGRSGGEDVWRRIGSTVIVTGGPLGFAALDLKTGRLRWQAPAQDGVRIASVADDRSVASTVCAYDGPRRCTVEVRDVETGKVTWTAATAPEAAYLGAPSGQRGPRTGALWPSRYVILIEPGTATSSAERYPDSWEPTRAPYRAVVRALDDGRVLRRIDLPERSLLALAGAGVVQSDVTREGSLPSTRVRLLDPATGRTRWTAEVDPGALQRPDGPGPWLAVQDGWIVTGPRSQLASYGLEIEGDELRLLDPRSGTVRAVPQPGARDLVVNEGPVTAVDAASAEAGPAPSRELVVSSAAGATISDPAAAGGQRRWDDPYRGYDDAAVTSTFVASALSTRRDLSGARHRGIELRDRRTGEVVGQLIAGQLSSPRRVGERVVARDRVDGELRFRVLRP